MHKRTFSPAFVDYNGKVNRYYVRSLSVILLNGSVEATGRNAYCRGCGTIIPNDVKKLIKHVEKNYGYKGVIFTTFSYCLKCAKALLQKEIKMCEEFIEDNLNLIESISHKDKLHSTKRIKEMELIEAI